MARTFVVLFRVLIWKNNYTGDNGCFPFTKKFENFLLGISVWEKRIPFVTSPILGRPGGLRDRERQGTGGKTGNL